MNDGSPLKYPETKCRSARARETHGNQARIREFGNLGNTHKILTDGDGMIRDIGNLCDPGGMRDRQMFRNRRADLRGIAVGCLTSADNQIRAADHLNTLRRR